MTILIRLDEELINSKKVFDEIKAEAMKDNVDIVCGYIEMIKEDFYKAGIRFYFADSLKFTHDSKNSGFVIATRFKNRLKEKLENELEKKATILEPMEINVDGVRNAKIEENKYSRIIIYSSNGKKVPDGDKIEVRYR